MSLQELSSIDLSQRSSLRNSILIALEVPRTPIRDDAKSCKGRYEEYCYIKRSEELRLGMRAKYRVRNGMSHRILGVYVYDFADR